MFYACSLDPENCGVKFGSKLLDIFLSSNKPRPTRQVSLSPLMDKILSFSSAWYSLFNCSNELCCGFVSPSFFHNRMSAVAYLASYLARGKFLPVSYVASMLKRLTICYLFDLYWRLQPVANILFLLRLLLLSKNCIRLVDECADYCRICNDDIRPEAHQLFYSGCQVYILHLISHLPALVLNLYLIMLCEHRRSCMCCASVWDPS